MSTIFSVAKSLKSNISTISQLAAVLLQLLGTFLVRPDFFNIYQDGQAFLAGNYPVIIMLFISIIFIYLSTSFKKREHAKSWLVICIVAFVGFSFTYYKYSQTLDTKTALLKRPDLAAQRIITGDTYLPNVQKCADEHGIGGQVMEVIENCSEITNGVEIDKIWPKEQIFKNRDMLLICYSMSMMLACISIITGIQAIKCKNTRKTQAKKP
jgi:hypothetical protein